MEKRELLRLAIHFFKDDEINKIALVAPSATLIVIRDFKVVEKKQVEIPKKIERNSKMCKPQLYHKPRKYTDQI